MSNLVVVTGTGPRDSLGNLICEAIANIPGYTPVPIYRDEPPNEVFGPAYKCDLRRFADIEDLPGNIGRPVAGIVNCAGINRQDWLDEVKPETWMEIMAVNGMAPVILTGAFMRAGALQRGGFVCNIISNASHIPMTGSNAYNASKGALHIATLQMARELTPKNGISVFGVSPNKLAGTGMSQDIEGDVLRLRGWDAGYAKKYQLNALLNKEETPPEVVADLVAYVISQPELRKFMSGCIIPIGA